MPLLFLETSQPSGKKHQRMGWLVAYLHHKAILRTYSFLTCCTRSR